MRTIKRKSRDNNKLNNSKNLEVSENLDRTIVANDIAENINYIREKMKHCKDVIYRDFYIGEPQIHLFMVYIENMINKELINNQVLKSLTDDRLQGANPISLSLDIIKNRLLTVSQVSVEGRFDNLILLLLSGNTLLFIEGFDSALVIDSMGAEKRGVEESVAERTVKGPREGFTEDLQVNISLLRRRIKDPSLAVEMLKVGRRSKTDVAVIYIKDIMREGMAEEIKSKIDQIDTDSIIGSATLEQLIEGHRWTMFPQVLATERPDRVLGNILEGKAAVIVNGTPYVMVMPVTFSSFISSPDDYYERTIISSILRIVRYLCFYMSTSLQATYLALVAYHPGMLPTSLALSITGSRLGVPFPLWMEVLLMEFILYVLQEAAIRLPGTMGQTVGIVGGLVIGQAIVQAGLVGPINVVIVAATAIASFALPVYTFTLSTRVVRLLLIITASTLGLYGIIMGWVFLLIHMASLEMLGVRYLSDFSPFQLQKMKDTVLKLPKSMMNERPEFMKVRDTKRQNYKKEGGQNDEG